MAIIPSVFTLLMFNYVCGISIIGIFTFCYFSHYSVPLVPDIEGLDTFEGDVVHSHDYRVPESYKDKVVVCLGGNASGQDLGLDIAKLAKKVTCLSIY